MHGSGLNLLVGLYFQLDDALLRLKADGFEQDHGEPWKYRGPHGTVVDLVQQCGGLVEVRLTLD